MSSLGECHARAEHPEYYAARRDLSPNVGRTCPTCQQAACGGGWWSGCYRPGKPPGKPREGPSQRVHRWVLRRISGTSFRKVTAARPVIFGGMLASGEERLSCE